MRFFHIAGTDTATTLSIVPAQLIDAQDPPQPIPVLELKTLPLGIDTEVIVTAPPAVTRNLLHPAAPNPFNPRTEIAFDLAADGRAQLAVYDLAGRLVRVLVDRPLRAGPHAFIWDGIDHAGRRVASGVYLYALRPETGDQIVRKMTLLK